MPCDDTTLLQRLSRNAVVTARVAVETMFTTIYDFCRKEKRLPPPAKAGAFRRIIPMKLWNRYYTPSTIDQALDLLQQYDGNARIIAGGTDLLVELREMNRPPIKALVDITTIPALTQIDHNNDIATIGAGVTHTQIVKSTPLADRATCLVESCGVVGGPQVRNIGTLGGNVAHALPAGDGTTSLVALDAKAEIVLDGNRQWIPILEMYKGPGTSLLNPTHDLLLRFRFQLSSDREATAFKRIMRPQGVALPILGCAVWVRLNEACNAYEDVRICIAPVAPTPQRITEVENTLRGQPVADLEQAIRVAIETLTPRTSKYRATAGYRREMIAVLLHRTLPLAVERARTGKAVPEGIGIK